jgi:hypothetical protein
MRRGFFLSFVACPLPKIRNSGLREVVFLARSLGSLETSTWLQRGDKRNVIIIKNNFMDLKGAMNICKKWSGFWGFFQVLFLVIFESHKTLTF